MLNKKVDKAIDIFERIAKSSKKDTKYCINLTNLGRINESDKPTENVDNLKKTRLKKI